MLRIYNKMIVTKILEIIYWFNLVIFFFMGLWSCSFIYFQILISIIWNLLLAILFFINFISFTLISIYSSIFHSISSIYYNYQSLASLRYFASSFSHILIFFVPQIQIYLHPEVHSCIQILKNLKIYILFTLICI